jgi:HEAT repeat protein
LAVNGRRGHSAKHFYFAPCSLRLVTFERARSAGEAHNDMDNAEKIASLITDLEHSDKPRIRLAVDALIALAADSPELKTTLNELINDPRRRNHWPVAYILGHLPQPSGAVVRTLLDSLDHREPDIRWAIALLLVRMAKAEGNLVELLIELCAAGTANQKRMAVYCIRDLNLTDSLSLLALLNAVRDMDPSVRVAAVTSLKTRSDVDVSGRNSLVQIFSNDPEPKVRNAIAITLAQMGSPSEEFLTALKKAGESENAQIKKAAFAALALLRKRRSAPSGS